MTPWTLLLFACLCGADNPDHLGLKASPALLIGPDSPLTLPLKFWANSRKSALKPRRRDLHEATLLNLLGHDYDPRWMRTARHINNQVSVKKRMVLPFFSFFVVVFTLLPLSKTTTQMVDFSERSFSSFFHTEKVFSNAQNVAFSTKTEKTKNATATNSRKCYSH